MAASRTPTPWALGRHDKAEIFAAGTNKEIAYTGECDGDEPSAEAKANAAFIVQAVNAHAGLVAEVERLRDALMPFAAEAWGYGPDEADNAPAWDTRPTIGQLRRARAALEPSK